MKESSKLAKMMMCAGLMATMACASGCAFLIGGAVGAGGMAYAKGDVNETVPASLESVTTAVKAVLAERKLAIKETTKTTDGVLYAAGAEGADVSPVEGSKLKTSVKCVAKGDASTEITVRAGTIGNEERGRDLLDAIKRGLK